MAVPKLPITYILPSGSGDCPVKLTANVILDGGGIAAHAAVVPNHGVLSVLSLFGTNSLFPEDVEKVPSQLVAPFL